MAHSTVVKNFRDGTILIQDATGTPLAATVQYEAGDFSISGLTSTQKEVTTYLDRGDLGSVRHTTQTFPSGSFTLHFTDLTDGSYATVYDLVNKKGSAAAAVSTLGANADVYAVKITATIEGTDHGDDSDHVIVLDDCVASVDFSEGDPSSLSISFTCYGTIALS
tara:strand:- start:869 stop:1363 length:495 start_codon:yes stop_codon:yes gene_type:complete